MIRIEIVSSHVEEKSGNKNGKDWRIREQGAWAHLLGEDGKFAEIPGVLLHCPGPGCARLSAGFLHARSALALRR